MTVWNSIYSFFYTLFNQVIAAFHDFRVVDILDILAIAFLIYKSIELLRETRAKQLVKGLFVLLLVWLMARWFDLVSLNWLLTKVLDYALIALAIIFQPELRRALEKVGRSSFGKLFGIASNNNNSEVLQCIDAVCRAATYMQEQKCGALMVIERQTQLGDIVNTGTVIDSKASSDLICNVFYPKSPLHDGAMIIRDGRLLAAGCILPLTANTNLSNQLGTRHRAAIGMSENSDALVVVVSEETGNISIALNGGITRDYNGLTLRETLIRNLVDEQNSKEPAKNIKGLFNNLKKKRGDGNEQ